MAAARGPRVQQLSGQPSRSSTDERAGRTNRAPASRNNSAARSHAIRPTFVPPQSLGTLAILEFYESMDVSQLTQLHLGHQNFVNR